MTTFNSKLWRLPSLMINVDNNYHLWPALHQQYQQSRSLNFQKNFQDHIWIKGVKSWLVVQMTRNDWITKIYKLAKKKQKFTEWHFKLPAQRSCPIHLLLFCCRRYSLFITLPNLQLLSLLIQSFVPTSSIIWLIPI